MPMTNEKWRSVPLINEKMQKHITHIQELRAAEITTAHVVETSVRWRIVPLKQRDAAYTYKGILDPNKESTEGKNLYSEFASCLGVFIYDFSFLKSDSSCCTRSVR